MGEVIYAGFGDVEEERWLGKRELARDLGYAVGHIERLSREGLPSKMHGRRRIYRLTHSLEWLLSTGRARHAGHDFEAMLHAKRLELGRGRLPDPPIVDRPPPAPISA